MCRLPSANGKMAQNQPSSSRTSSKHPTSWKTIQTIDICIRLNTQLKNRFQVLAVEETITDKEEKEELERKSEIMGKAYVKTAGRY